jgi:hypothetical protein
MFFIDSTNYTMLQTLKYNLTVTGADSVKNKVKVVALQNLLVFA